MIPWIEGGFPTTKAVRMVYNHAPMNYTNSNSKLRRLMRLSGCGLVLLGLSACASVDRAVPQAKTQKTPDMQQEVAVQQSVSSVEEVPLQTGLTEALLYDLLLSSIAFQVGEVEVSADALIRAARASDDPQVISRAVRMGVHSKRYAEAAKLGQRWIELMPNDHFAYIITGLAAVMDNQADLALQNLQTLMRRDEAKVSLRFQQTGEVFLRYVDNPSAVTVFKQLAAQYPDKIQAWLVLAGIAQKTRDFESMEVAIDQLLRLEPGNEKAAEYKLLVLTGKPEAQQAFAQGFLESNPRANEFRMLFARHLLSESRHDLAIVQLRELVKHDKKNSDAMGLLGLLYQSVGNYDKAAETFRQQLKLQPQDERTRMYLASALEAAGRYDEAMSELAQVHGSKELLNAQRQMALLIERLEGVDASLAYLGALKGQDQDEDALLLIEQELMLKRAGRDAEAKRLLDDAVKQYPANESLLYHRALSWVEGNDLAAHEADMRVLLASQPDNAQYNNTLGYSLLTLSDRLQMAGELIDKAYSQSPEDPYILDSKGWLEYKRGNLESALKYLLSAFKLDQDAEIAAHIGEVYWVLGQPEKAREFWDKGEKIEATNKTLINTRARFLNQESAE